MPLTVHSEKLYRLKRIITEKYPQPNPLYVAVPMHFFFNTGVDNVNYHKDPGIIKALGAIAQKYRSMEEMIDWEFVLKIICWVYDQWPTVSIEIHDEIWRCKKPNCVFPGAFTDELMACTYSFLTYQDLNEMEL